MKPYYYIIHPLLFATYPILFLFLKNEEFIPSEDIFTVAVIVGSFTSIIFILLNIFLKDKKKTAIIITILLILFFSYGHIYNLIFDLIEGSAIKQRYLLTIYFLVFGCSFFLIINTRKDLIVYHYILNIMAISLISFNLLTYLGSFHKEVTERHILSDRNVLFRATLDNYNKLPDIYYIILDGYANNKTLNEIYGYDNSDFLNYLVSKGFYIASNSCSNYSQTFLSLASSLNMEYINQLSWKIKPEMDYAIPVQMIRRNNVMLFLKSLGYKYIHFRSGEGATNDNKYADAVIACGSTNIFAGLLIQTSILLPLSTYFDDVRERILCTFSNLGKIKNVKGPKFVFAHILTPHYPFVFDINGESTVKSKSAILKNEWMNKEGYINQLIYVNKRVKDIIDNILPQSLDDNYQPIIILQSDHGPGSTADNIMLETNQNHRELIKERMRILNAYYLPNNGKKFLYDSISPVNSFRLILTHYFNTNITQLDDRCYFSDYISPYKFIDVTRELN